MTTFERTITLEIDDNQKLALIFALGIIKGLAASEQLELTIGMERSLDKIARSLGVEL